MRNIFLLTGLAFFVSANIFAQTEKKSLVMCSQFGIYNYTSKDKKDVTLDIHNDKNSSFDVSAKIGYLIIKNFEVGGNYTSLNDDYESESTNNLYTYSYSNKYSYRTKIIGLYSKLHKNIVDNFGLLCEFELGYGLIKNNIHSSQLSNTYPSNDIISTEIQTGSTIDTKINVGFEYYIKKRLGFELKVDLFNFEKGKINEKLTYDIAPPSMTPYEGNHTISHIEFCQPSIYFGIKYILILKSEEK